MKTLKGTKLVYSHVFEKLENQKLYSLYMIREFAMNNQLLEPGPDDDPNIDPKILDNRLRCTLVRVTTSTKTGRRLPKPDGSVKHRGKIEPAWLGATVKLYLLDQWPEEQEQLEKVRHKFFAQRSAGKMSVWLKNPRIWIATAALVAVACTAPPIRNFLGTLVTEGVAAARELAYSIPAKTPEALFQQGWTDYRSGEYKAAAQKAHTILSGEDVTDHTRANSWYLLGSVDWETGASDAALANFRKAFDLYEASGDALNMYQVSLAMAKVDTSIDDYASSNERLQKALLIYDTDGGEHIPHLGEYHATAIELAAKLGDSAAALAHARQRHEIYQGSNQLDFLADAKSDLGFWHAASGCPEQAQLRTLEAARLIFKLKDETRYNYNELNWILIRRLQGYRPDTATVDSIKGWAKARGDSRVEALLDLALTLEPTKEFADDENCFESVEPE